MIMKPSRGRPSPGSVLAVRTAGAFRAFRQSRSTSRRTARKRALSASSECRAAVSRASRCRRDRSAGGMASARFVAACRASGSASATRQFPIVTAEAAVADAVQGGHETPRGQSFERGQEEALFRTGQTDRDPAPGEQVEERAAIEKLCCQPMRHALRFEPHGEATGELGLLVTDDRHGRRPLLKPHR